MTENPLLADPVFVIFFAGMGFIFLYAAIMNWLDDRK